MKTKADHIEGPAGKTALLTGNEAIARGALECGVAVVTGYPGTPASEIVDYLAILADKHGFHAEWSVNEKVAFEVAAGASLAGIRSLCSMKCLGVNWIADPLTVIAYTGVNGGCVIVTADDPAQMSSQCAEDTRYFATLCKIPCIEPADGQQAKDLLKEAYVISEKLQLPVLFRITPRICHATFDVKFDKTVPPKREGKFEKNPDRYVMISTNSIKRHPLLNKKLKEASEIFSDFPFNKTEGEGKFGIIACGVTANYVDEIIFETKLKAKVLKLVTTYPLPERLITEFLKGVDKVLVVEELEPITELYVRTIVQKNKLQTEIHGKLDEELLPRHDELNADLIGRAIEKLTGHKFTSTNHKMAEEASALVSKRIPALCAGCPHRGTYYGIKRALARLGGGIITGDRGCYNQGALPPLSGMDTCICMGASIPIASGLEHAKVKQPVVAAIGDGTFYHAGLQGLINAVHNESKTTTVIFDNNWTCMTGHQPNPGTGINARGHKVKPVNTELLVRSCGVNNVKVVDAYNVKEVEKAVEAAIKSKEPSVVISRRPCMVHAYRALRAKGEKPKKYKVDAAKCKGCKKCLTDLGCPALGMENGKAVIDDFCMGCGICTFACPLGAIKQ